MVKPMLAVQAEIITFPVLVSPKIDGIRAIVLENGDLVSRNLKPIRNKHTQASFGRVALEGLDGELTVGPPNAQDVMQATSSGVMSEDGTPNATFWVFDFWNDPTVPYIERYRALERAASTNFGMPALGPRIQLLEQVAIGNLDDLNEMEKLALSNGYEGLMVRSPNGRYKYGRSTAREGLLLKLKRFIDSEAEIIDFEEYMHNENEPTIDNLGYQVRSSHKGNKVPGGMLGALICRDVNDGRPVDIGTGFTHDERKWIWERREQLLGKIVTYKYFGQSGIKDAPRFPVYKAFRDPSDMGE